MIDLDEMAAHANALWEEQHGCQPCDQAEDTIERLLLGLDTPYNGDLFEFMFGARNCMPFVYGDGSPTALCYHGSYLEFRRGTHESLDRCVLEQLVAMYFDLADNEIKPAATPESESE